MENHNRPESLKSARCESSSNESNAVHECRGGRRIPYHSTVEVDTPAGLWKGIIQNISKGGLFVDTKIPLGVGQKCEVRLHFRSGNHSMKLLIQVVRETNEGVGLKFI
jgi:hypothetical protein